MKYDNPNEPLTTITVATWHGQYAYSTLALLWFRWVAPHTPRNDLRAVAHVARLMHAGFPGWYFRLLGIKVI